MSILRVNSIQLNDQGNAAVGISNSWNVTITSGGLNALVVGSNGDVTVNNRLLLTSTTGTQYAVNTSVETAYTQSNLAISRANTALPNANTTLAGTLTITGDLVPSSSFMRNKIINGDGNIAQRGSNTALTSTVSYVSVDRWAARQIGTPSAFLAKNTTVVPTGFASSIQTFRPNGATTTGVVELIQVMESVNSIPLQNTAVTFSFYAKAGANFSAASSNVVVSLFTGTGTDQSAASMGSWTGVTSPLYTTQAVTTTWTRYTYTVNVPATATQLGVYFNWTPSGTAGADDSLYVTGVQLEQGSNATPYERRQYQQELALCQRYYLQWTGSSATYGYLSIGSGFTSTTNQIIVMIPTPVTMRSTASLPSASFSGNIVLQTGVTSASASAINIVYVSGPNSVFVAFSQAGTTFTIGNAAVAYTDKATTSIFALTSEL